MRLEREGTCALCADRAYCMHQWSKRRSGFRYHLLTERVWKSRRTNLKTIKTFFLQAVCMTLRAVSLCVCVCVVSVVVGHKRLFTELQTVLLHANLVITTAKHIVFYRRGTVQGVTVFFLNPYPTAFPYGNGMVLHFYHQQESSTTKTVHKVINKGLKTYV